MTIEVDNWDYTTPDNITLISGTDVDEGMLPGLVNNALRRIASAVAMFRQYAYSRDKNVTIAASGGALPTGVLEGHLFLEY